MVLAEMFLRDLSNFIEKYGVKTEQCGERSGLSGQPLTPACHACRELQEVCHQLEFLAPRSSEISPDKKPQNSELRYRLTNAIERLDQLMIEGGRCCTTFRIELTELKSVVISRLQEAGTWLETA